MIPQRIAFSPAPKKIRWRGKSLTVAEAGALAAREQQIGHFQAAAEIFKLLLAKIPRSAELHNNLGVVLQQMARHPEALASYDKAVALKPDYVAAWFNRGTVLKKLNRHEEALASYDRAIALKPDHADAHNNRGIIFQEWRRYDEAVADYRQAVACQPGHAEAHQNLGTALMSRGDLAEAEQMFRRASELKPDFAAPLFCLAHLRDYHDADNAEAKRIQAALTHPGISTEDKEHFYFALGKIYDDCGRYDEAFEFYRQANEIRNRQANYHSGAVEKLTDGIIKTFSEEFLARPLAFASNSRAPVFIIGMPRSGTTLLANILSKHRAVALAGELSAIDDLTGGSAAAARQLTAASAERLIADYEKRLRRDVGPDAALVIDKNPLNFRHAGLISLLFPRAKIFHCTRHPLDTCLSNYFQRFPLRLDYSFDLRNIGHFYGQYDRLMKHWRKIPALKLMEIRYDEMILRTEETARRALEFLELDWDKRCLSPHTNPYPVETASQWQVRQPIYRHSLERWRHYEKHLADLKKTLAENGVTSHSAE